MELDCCAKECIGKLYFFSQSYPCKKATLHTRIKILIRNTAGIFFSPGFSPGFVIGKFSDRRDLGGIPVGTGFLAGSQWLFYKGTKVKKIICETCMYICFFFPFTFISLNVTRRDACKTCIIRMAQL